MEQQQSQQQQEKEEKEEERGEETKLGELDKEWLQRRDQDGPSAGGQLISFPIVVDLSANSQRLSSALVLGIELMVHY